MAGETDRRYYESAAKPRAVANYFKGITCLSPQTRTLIADY